MSNNKGVHRIARSALEAVARGASHGLSRGSRSARRTGCRGASATAPASPPPPGAAATAGSGTRPRTVAVVDPTRLGRNPTSPPVLIQRVLVDGELSTSLTSLELLPGSRRIEIEYEGLRLSSPERVTFRHRLVGLDTGWHETTRRSVEFTTLPPGAYRFEVAAAADGGCFGGTPAHVEIRVVPRLHQTRLFCVAPGRGRGRSGLDGVPTAEGSGAPPERRRGGQDPRPRRRDAACGRGKPAAGREQRPSSKGCPGAADSLTGLANRRQLDEALDTEWRRCGRLGRRLPWCCSTWTTSRTSTTPSATRPATTVCGRWPRSWRRDRRAGDVVARYGGEEFLALLPGTGEREAEELAEQVRVAVEALRIPHVVPGGRVTISGGVASIVPDSERPEDLTSVADEALYEAKRQGRNHIVRSRSSLSVSGRSGSLPDRRHPGGRPGTTRKTD